jgi:hypothetical protein
VHTALSLAKASAILGHSNGDASAMHAFRAADKKIGGGYLYRTVVDYLHTEVAPQRGCQMVCGAPRGADCPSGGGRPSPLPCRSRAVKLAAA